MGQDWSVVTVFGAQAKVDKLKKKGSVFLARYLNELAGLELSNKFSKPLLWILLLVINYFRSLWMYKYISLEGDIGLFYIRGIGYLKF